MKIEITTPVKHDGKRYKVGDTPDMKKKDAEHLIEIGVAVKVDSGGKKKDDAEPPETSDSDNEEPDQPEGNESDEVGK